MPREMTDKEREVLLHVLQEEYPALSPERLDEIPLITRIATLVRVEDRIKSAGGDRYGSMTLKEMRTFIDDVEAGNIDITST